MPCELNFRANIYGMKQLGVDHLVSVSTAGSMKEEIAPGDLVVPDQFIDHTYKRPATFFGDGIVAHVSLADPVCAALARELVAAAGEGRRDDSSTAARISASRGRSFRLAPNRISTGSWGVDVISMTAMQEARLAREAEMCYAALVLVTDYDCWHESVAAVDIGEILRVMRLNVEHRAERRGDPGAAARRRARATARARSALKDAIITDRAVIPPKVAADLRPIIGKYLAMNRSSFVGKARSAMRHGSADSDE